MLEELPRREREIFEILCGGEDMTAAEVRGRMASPPSYSAVRTLLKRLENKGFADHRVIDQTYVYRGVPKPEKVRETVLRQIVNNLFGGSAVRAATALLGMAPALDGEEMEALQQAIHRAAGRNE